MSAAKKIKNLFSGTAQESIPIRQKSPDTSKTSDKQRIEELREALKKKISHDPEQAKKAAMIIEGLIKG